MTKLSDYVQGWALRRGAHDIAWPSGAALPARSQIYVSSYVTFPYDAVVVEWASSQLYTDAGLVVVEEGDFPLDTDDYLITQEDTSTLVFKRPGIYLCEIGTLGSGTIVSPEGVADADVLMDVSISDPGWDDGGPAFLTPGGTLQGPAVDLVRGQQSVTAALYVHEAGRRIQVKVSAYLMDVGEPSVTSAGVKLFVTRIA